MLDRYATAIIQPVVDTLAKALFRAVIKADHLTLLAFSLGFIAAFLIAAHAYLLGAAIILASRLCDALDGAVARQTMPTDAGGFLDITLDMLFYASIPLAFAFANPPVNALPAAMLLAAFIGTGSSFLAFAALAAKRGMASDASQGSANLPIKSLYFLGGLTEATETLGFFIAMCLWPGYFVQLSLVFAALCCITIATRIVGGWRRLQ
jgi:phosphatidylglycerophosphate synthase